MGRKPRSKEIIESEVGLYHVTSRCVRRAFLMGEDRLSGMCYDERRAWILARLLRYAPHFKIDVISFSLMANHFHLVLRNRPDLVAKMSDEEIVRAWWAISPQCRNKKGEPCRLTPNRLEKLLKDKQRVATCRKRLSSISWLMRYLKHPVAIRANAKDGRSGHFFEGRFRVRPITSLGQLSRSMVYTDLNPIRAGLANSIPTSEYTSGQFRYLAAKRRRELRKKKGADHAKRKNEALVRQEELHEQVDAILSPIQIRDEPASRNRDSNDPESTTELLGDRRRASDLGVLPITTEKYLALLDILGRRETRGKRGKIPRRLPPILLELGIEPVDEWLKMYDEYVEDVQAQYQSKVNDDREAALVQLTVADDLKTNQHALM